MVAALWSQNAGRCVGLVLVSMALLPLSLAWTSVGHVAQRLRGRWGSASRRQGRRPTETGSPPRTVLVTGVGMAKGLTLARAFHRAGHRVVGADFEGGGIPCPGKLSRSLATFYPLPKPDEIEGSEGYVERVLDIVGAEDVDLWVSCSGVASAVEDGRAKEKVERRTSCRCIQFDAATTARLHEKDTFIYETTRLGLAAPATHRVNSVDDVLWILGESAASPTPDRKFILKPIGVDDAHRANMTLLPLETVDATRAYVCRLPISAERGWILQQFISGGEEYCTHALVVAGVVRCFVACPSAELLMHYRALPATSALSQAMLAFTREFVARSPGSTSMTGHLSFDFMVEDGPARDGGFERRLYAIECNPRAHTAVVLFGHGGGGEHAMVDAYLLALEDAQQKGTRALVTPPRDSLARYWIAHDLVTLVLLPAVRLARRQIGLDEFLNGCASFRSHLLSWKEGTHEAWDPLPALALYHLYWPLTIVKAWWHGREWSRLNVSTTKMFAL